jgi:hypothetical protein
MSQSGGTGQGEALAAWLLWALVLLALVVTYARLPVSELYRVDEGGLGGALGRALVLVNWPIALVALALVPIALDALPARAWWLAAPAVGLCAAIAAPGVIDEYDLDARPANAAPALGVAAVLALTIAAAVRAGPAPAPRRRGDPLRVVLALVVLACSLPWLAAELGTTFPEGVFLTSTPFREADGSLLPAVHRGHHHGWDGALLVLTVLLLSRVRLRSVRLDRTLAVVLGALGAYGLVNAAQDFWLEQVVKRGWVEWRIPGALRPSGSWIWLVILALAALLTAAFLRARDGPARPG